MSEKTQVIQGSDVRRQLAAGVNTLANAVKVTLGPRGQVVAIERKDATPILTKDGVTVARSINLRNKVENIAVSAIKEAASRTADTAGDGTTTSTVIAQSVFNEGLKLISAGYKPSILRNELEEAVMLVKETVAKMAVKITDRESIVHVGNISANGEAEIGQLLADALESVGPNGPVTIEEAKGFKTSLTLIDGVKYDRGYLSPYFVTDQEKMTADFSEPLILILACKIKSVQELLPALEYAAENQRDLLIIADDLEPEIMQVLVVNKLKGALSVCVIRPPSLGELKLELLDDLATMLGCTVVKMPSDITVSRLGSCKKIIVGRYGTIFIGTDREAADLKSKILSNSLQDPTLSDRELEFIKYRLSNLVAKVAVIKVGGATEVEVRERKDRVDDALHATQAALSDGIVPGGGVTLLKAVEVLSSLPENHLGRLVLQRACAAPFEAILTNAELSPPVFRHKLSEVTSSTIGVNALTGQVEDMLISGIIDPVKVVINALENGVAASTTLLTTGCVIVEDDKDT